MKYLKEILIVKKEEIRKIRRSSEWIKRAVKNTEKEKGSFLRNIKRDKVNVIAEIGRAHV